MAFANKGELKTAISEYAARSNASFLNKIDSFIALGEHRMQFGTGQPFPSKPLRTKSQERLALLTTDASFQITLPPDLLEIRAIYQNVSPNTGMNRLVFIEPLEFFANQVQQVTGGRPINYTIIGKAEDAGLSEGLVQVQPGAEGIELGLLYFTKIDPLVNDTDTNWILSNHPGLYLQGSLTEAFYYMRNGQMADSSFKYYSSMADGLKITEERSRRQGAVLSPRFSVQ